MGEKRREAGASSDPWNLARFVDAQDGVWPAVVDELRAGRKQSHWMWFVFPQLVGLGRSETARYYGIRGAEEARAYLDHPLLGARLLEASALVTAIEGRDLRAILGTPDDLKFRSSMSLFDAVAREPAPFARALERHVGGERDARTLALLAGTATP